MTYTPPLTGNSAAVRARQAIEHMIAESAVREILSHQGRITVDDGEEKVLKRSTDLDSILKAMFSVDEERLFIAGPHADRYFGWVFFVYGNDGWDVISDYTTSLDDWLTKTNAIADAFCNGELSPKKWWE